MVMAVAWEVGGMIVAALAERELASKAATSKNELLAMSLQNSSYGVPVALVYGRNRFAGNLIWYGDFTQTGGGSGGKGGASQQQSPGYAANVEIGVCEGPVSGITTVWASKSLTDLSDEGLSLYTGTSSQSPPGFMVTNHSGQDLSYHNTAYVAGYVQLDSSGSLPNYTFLVDGFLEYNPGAGIYDAEPSAIITDLLTSTQYGAGIDPVLIGDLTQFRNYCVANGLFMSPVWAQQQTAVQCVNDILKYTNSAAYVSEGQLKITPLGDSQVTGNGVTFTPNLTPVYDLADDDFIVKGPGEPPVQCIRKQQSDTYNSMTLEFKDSTNQYNRAIAEAKDQADIDRYGLRIASSVTSKAITNPTTARIAIQLMLQQQLYRRNQYKFTLGISKSALEPMDLVTITDATLGLNRQLVRITQIDEQNGGDLDVIAIEELVGVSSAPLYSMQPATSFAYNYKEDPGPTNAPLFIVPPTQLTGGGLEVWVGASGAGSVYGGCDVWVSSDDATYVYGGHVVGSARTGVTANSIPLSADPDTSDALIVNLSQSLGTLLSGTQADADDFRTLCYLGTGELISYETATLVAPNEYSLSYLRRGVYGSPITAVPLGSSFFRLDPNQVFRYKLDKTQIGKPFYVKLLPFNVWGGGEYALASVPAYSYTVALPPAPPQVQGFRVTQSSTSVVFSWYAVVDYALKGYDIYYGPQGVTQLSQMHLLTESSMGTEMTNAAVPPGTWTFAIVARDVADQISPVASFQDLDVANPNPTYISAEQAPGWPGYCFGFVKHEVAGVLVPQGQYPCSHYTDWSWCTEFCPDPVATAVYQTPEYDMAQSINGRVYRSDTVTAGWGVSGSPTSEFDIDYWTSGSDPGTYTLWTIGGAVFQHIRGQLKETVGTVPALVSEFRLTADVGLSITQSGTLSVAATGTTLTFNTPYNVAPVVKPTAIAASDLTCTVANITTTGCTFYLWDSTGAGVAGLINWEATGS